MNLLVTPAIILQTRPIREADTLVVLLSEQHGRVSAFARNARKSQRRFMGGLDLFDCGLFELTPSRTSGQAYCVEQVKKREHWPELRENLKKFSAASFCLELTSQFARDDDHDSAALFAPLYHCLRAINSSKSDAEGLAIALFFNLILLKLSGFNFIDDSSRIARDTDLCRWFEEMLEKRQPIVPYNSALLRQGFHALVAFTQEILGAEIRSAAAL